MNKNPSAARLAKRNKAAQGDIQALRELVWRVVVKLEKAIAAAPGITQDTLKVCNSLAQLAPVFLKTVEVGEMESRLAQLEQQQQDP